MDEIIDTRSAKLNVKYIRVQHCNRKAIKIAGEVRIALLNFKAIQTVIFIHLARMQNVRRRPWILFFCSTATSIDSVLQGSALGMSFWIVHFESDLLKIIFQIFKILTCENELRGIILICINSLPMVFLVDTCSTCPFQIECVGLPREDNQREVFSQTQFSEWQQIFVFAFVFSLPYNPPWRTL